MTLTKESIRETFLKWRTGGSVQARAADKMMEYLNDVDVVLYGGAIRDMVLGVAPRDLDFVARQIGGRELRRRLREHVTDITGFEGSKLTIDGVPIDIWPFESTWAFARLGITNPVLPDLMKTSFFNLENVAITMKDFVVYEGGFIEAMETRILEVNFWDNPFPVLAVLRSLVTLKRFKMSPGPKLRQYIEEYGPKIKIEALMRLQLKHYKQEHVSADVMRVWGVGSQV